jgi:hypothetical protein
MIGLSVLQLGGSAKIYVVAGMSVGQLSVGPNFVSRFAKKLI